MGKQSWSRNFWGVATITSARKTLVSEGSKTTFFMAHQVGKLLPRFKIQPEYVLLLPKSLIQYNMLISFKLFFICLTIIFLGKPSRGGLEG